MERVYTLEDIFIAEEMAKRIKIAEPKFLDIIKDMIVDRVRVFLLSETRDEIFKYYGEAKPLMKIYADIKNIGLVNINPNDLVIFGLFDILHKMVKEAYIETRT
jgi:hypothetical protein